MSTPRPGHGCRSAGEALVAGTLSPRLCLKGGLEKAFAESIECCVCLDIAHKAVQCSNQHIACAACMARCGVCPLCKVPVAEAKPARLVRELVSQLQVRCRGASHGCSTLCTLGTVVAHELVCGLCEAPCPNAGCHERVLRQDLPAHRGTCPEELVPCAECPVLMRRRSLQQHRCDTCPHCGDHHMRSQEAAHEAVCPKFPMDCIICQHTMPREQAVEHRCADVLAAVSAELKQVKAKSRRNEGRLALWRRAVAEEFCSKQTFLEACGEGELELARHAYGKLQPTGSVPRMVTPVRLPTAQEAVEHICRRMASDQSPKSMIAGLYDTVWKHERLAAYSKVVLSRTARHLDLAVWFHGRRKFTQDALRSMREAGRRRGQDDVATWCAETLERLREEERVEEGRQQVTNPYSRPNSVVPGASFGGGAKRSASSAGFLLY